MSVIMTLRVPGDPKAVERMAQEDPERMQRITGLAKSHGLIAHRFYGSENQLLVIDEWPDAESFQRFFAEAEADVGPMMQAAAHAAAETAGKEGRRRPIVIGVTVLTSMDDATLASVGVRRPLLEQVVTLARMAQDAGLDGVVASPQETAAIRAACGPDFAIVTPGIRGASAGTTKNDQSRTMGPADAIKAGASYIVVGRPIIAATDPRAAAAAIVDELESVNA